MDVTQYFISWLYKVDLRIVLYSLIGVLVILIVQWFAQLFER